MHIVISGGGTGGHVYPALAIADQLKKKGVTVSFIGTLKGIESTLVPEHGYTLDTLTISGFLGKSLTGKILSLAGVPLSVMKAVYYLVKRKASCVVITGGYVAFPVAVASFLTGRQCFIQEQNAFPGLTNRLSSRFAKTVYTGFKDQSGYFGKKEIFTGNPVREEFKSVSPCTPNESSPLKLLVTGGSQGSLLINNLMRESSEKLKDMNIEIKHITGKRWIDEYSDLKRQRYCVLEYADNIKELVEWADLVLCRSGASMMAELGLSGRPAILVPFKAATNNHQYYNARSFEQAGAGIMLSEDNISSDLLAATLEELEKNRNNIAAMAEQAKTVFPADAAQLIVEDILKKMEG